MSFKFELRDEHKIPRDYLNSNIRKPQGNVKVQSVLQNRKTLVVYLNGLASNLIFTQDVNIFTLGRSVVVHM